MLKTWKGFVAGIAAVLAVSDVASTAHAAKCGDLDNNGTVAINDVVLHLNIINGGNPAAACGGAGYADCADLDGKGPIGTDTNDVVLELNKASGIVNCKPDQCIHETVLNCAGPTNIPTVGSGTNLFVPNTCDARVTGQTFVNAGGILNIQPGTTIKGTTGSPVSTLIVKPGGRINSSGTLASPIVFTSAGAPPVSGDWGGVNILGKAPVNQPNITLEGLPPAPDLVYGGTDGNDFSGCMTFTRVNYGGRELTPDNELNNLTLAGVGRKTIIHHVQAHRGFDDDIEWFGGTVNTSFLVASACGDDCFDTQLGTVGGVQFGLGEQEAESVETPGSNGFENDNSEFGFNNTPINNPKYCNITMLGAKYSSANPGTTNQLGILSRRGNAITIANSIIKDFRQAGYQLRDPETSVHACVAPGGPLNTTPPIGQIINSLFNNNGSGGTVHALDNASCPSGGGGGCQCSSTEHFALLAAKNTIGTTDASIAAIGGSSFPRTNLVPPGGSLAATHPAADCTLINSSFVSAPYIGAFQPGGTDWTAGWTAFP